MPPPSRHKLSRNHHALQRVIEMMGHNEHYLFRGEVWFRHPESVCTKVLLCGAKTYVGTICGNTNFPELLDAMPFLEKILCDPQCVVIPQLEMDKDIIEVTLLDILMVCIAGGKT